jgi:K+-dependent Na+/Ca+ exchanger-like protein
MFKSNKSNKRVARLEILPYMLIGSSVIIGLICGGVYIRDNYGIENSFTNLLGVYHIEDNIEQRLLFEEGGFCYGMEDYGGGIGIIIPILLILYVFVGLAVVCDEFFQGSLERISEVLNLTPDVAGATFLAAGSSAPELFTSLSDAFGESSSIGMGTIVGSAMFNILIIVALAASIAGKGGNSLNIDYRPVTRDVVFYLCSIILLGVFFEDGKIVLYESIFLVLLYFVYILFMTRNEQILNSFPAPNLGEEKILPTEESTEKDIELANLSTQIEEEEKSINTSDDKDSKKKIEKIEKEIKTLLIPGLEDKSKEKGYEEVDEVDEEEDVFFARFALPSDKSDWPLYFLTTLFRFIFSLTIPDTGIAFFHNWYVLSFIMSILWIGVLCHFMVVWATEAACILNISPIVMGILVLAVGTSVPDAIGSMIAARNGEADMAIANAIGSNVFDILLGLGLPWLMVIIIRGKDVNVCNDGILVAVIILFCTACLFVGVLKFNKWKMNNKIGNALLVLYFLYVVYTILGAALLKPKC